MIEKLYYRMQEIEKAFNFNNFDFRYLCENSNVPIHTYVYSRYFILAERVPRSFKKKIRGVAYYKGIIELPAHCRKQLLKDGNTPLSFSYLDDLNGILTLESCSGQLLTQLFEDNYQIEYVTSVGELDLSQCDAYLINEENRELLHHKDTPLPESLNIKIEDLVLKRELVDWCKLQLNIEEATPNTREHAIKEQIRIIHRDNPSLGGTKLYKLVLDNYENDIDTTDPLSILISIDRDELIWGKAGRNEYTISKKRFLNIFSEIKNRN
ncbi:MAG: hypothetical protein JXQ95_13235 [Alteromonas stellipolaris]|uniref:hypothetical protein n=1 Tax=Alteromonas stellipolaris TaxID=233316 RepID=UPI003B8CED0B